MKTSAGYVKKTSIGLPGGPTDGKRLTQAKASATKPY